MENKGYLQNKGITAIKTLYRIAGDKPIDDWDDKVRKMQKKRFQNDTLVQIKEHGNCGGETAIRRKLERWKDTPWCLNCPIGTAARRVTERIKQLGNKTVTPRVAAAVWNTIWNRWKTERRRQNRHGVDNRCRLGCNSGEDSIEHYCRCRRSRQFAQSKLRMEVEPELALNTWVLNFAEELTQDQIRCVATWVYSVYTVTNNNRVRNIWPSEERTKDALGQATKRAVDGDDNFAKWLDTRGRHALWRIG